MQAIQEINFDIAYRWWGSNIDHKQMDIDVVAESIDKRYLLVGECKWSKIDNTDKLLEDLTRKAALLPFASNK